MVLTQLGAVEMIPHLVAKLNQGESLVTSEHSRVFGPGGQEHYGTRGGKLYFKPSGWFRFALHVDDFDQYKSWRIAYHGTTNLNMLSILLRNH